MYDEKYDEFLKGTIINESSETFTSEDDTNISNFIGEEYETKTGEILYDSSKEEPDAGLPFGEMDDSAPEFNPLVTTVAAYKNINNSTGINKWSPIKLVKNPSISVTVPRYSIGRFVANEFNGVTRVEDLDIHDIDQIIPKITPKDIPEAADYLDADTKRTDPATGVITASIKTGITIPIKQLTDETDSAGGEFDFTDIIAPAGRVTAINVATEVAGTTELMHLKTDEVIAVSNIFVPTTEGEGKRENYKATFKFMVNKETKIVDDGESISTGAFVDSVNLATLVTGSYLVEVVLSGSIDLNIGVNEIKFEYASFNILKKIASDVEVDILADDPIHDVKFSMPSVDASLELTNTNDRSAGVSTAVKNNDYVFTVKPRGIFRDHLPPLTRDAIETIPTKINQQSGLTSISMSKSYLKSLNNFIKIVKIAIATKEKPHTICDMLRPVYAEASVAGQTPVIRKSSETFDESKAIIEQTIETLSLKMIKESGWIHVSKLYGLSGTKVRVLVPHQLNLGDFTLQDGTKVEVLYSTELEDNIKVTIEGIGGPMIPEIGAPMFTFSNTLMMPPKTYVFRKTKGSSTHRSVATQPCYEHIFKIPVIGEIKL